MVLVIDNYDSFVFNLARYIRNAGQQTLIVRNNEVSIDEIKIINPSHIVISPGPGTPIQAGISIDIVKYLYKQPSYSHLGLVTSTNLLSKILA